MAVAAAFTEVAVVHVLFAVTRDAVRVRISVMRLGRMAAFAIRGRVTAQQGEIGRRVVERIRVQPDDVRIATFVLGVTGGAFDRGHRLGTAVEPEPSVDVVVDLRVAIQAQRSLRRTCERLMTRRAFILVFGVTGDNRPGHQNALEHLCRSGVRSENHYEHGTRREPPFDCSILSHASCSTAQYI